MRVAVVGATGNAGTAVLSALHETPEVDSILAIARRAPDIEKAPYNACDWASIDIGGAVDEDEARADLRAAFDGVDTVIHLAWLIQPNSQRDLLRRVNVLGTAHVAQAAAEAGVGHLIVATSIASYSPDSGGEPRDESWPTGGIPTSHYSVDKAAQERFLDDFSLAYPQITVTRIRPALIFQALASSEIQRYFLGDKVPVHLLSKGTPPVLPLPEDLDTIQAVHADDLGTAFAAAVVTRAPGAFNICADDTLTADSVATILGGSRIVRLPTALVRTALAASHKTGMVAMDEGWLDMGVSVPVMDNSRAKTELGWQPQHSAADALRELIDGMVKGTGGHSIPLRARDRDHATIPGTSTPISHGGESNAGQSSTEDGADGEFGRHADQTADRELIELYLSDHLTGATAGLERIERMEEAFADTPVFRQISEVADKIRRERALLVQIIDDLGLKRKPYRQALAWLGEHAGRVKLNNRIISRSPMTLVLEAELMRSAVMGKLGGWQALHDNAETMGLDPTIFATLQEEAWQQIATLDEVHEYARRRAFRHDISTFGPQNSEES